MDKPSTSHEVASAMIMRMSGNHLDPDVVEAFVATERQFIDIRAAYGAEGTEDRRHVA